MRPPQHDANDALSPKKAPGQRGRLRLCRSAQRTRQAMLKAFTLRRWSRTSGTSLALAYEAPALLERGSACRCLQAKDVLSDVRNRKGITGAQLAQGPERKRTIGLHVEAATGIARVATKGDRFVDRKARSRPVL